ncbi:DegT/DnrJ/EryC1/StrS family aminotransferase [Streptomyces sp. NPDC057743]|uniref:DegT/DnrJ/EryC1/StrS family aminotransferase n=1 Tax=Streptomyces sp. NPDC057743 TaxID=3346236 RepID=UPI0036AFEC6B
MTDARAHPRELPRPAVPPHPGPSGDAAPADLPYAHPYWDDGEATALLDALRSGMWTNGSRVAEFERELTRLTGAPTLTLSSGTTAISALLRIVGERTPGPRLLVTPTLTFAAAPASARLLDWDVALCDVEADGLTLAPAALDALLHRVHRHYAVIVVVPVHYAGHTADLPALTALCTRYGADLVEDACHAIGGHYDDPRAPVGSWPGSLAAYYSFHPVKPVACGEGGAVATRDPALLERLRGLRNHNMTPLPDHPHDQAPWPYTIDTPGTNYRLSDFHAAVGTVQARRAEESRTERARLAERYHRAFAQLPAVRTVPGQQRPGSAHHLFPVVFDLAALGLSKRALLTAFRARRVHCQIHYSPLHRLDAFAGTPAQLRTEFPVADAVFPGLVSLPLWRGMRETDDQDRVIDIVTGLATDGRNRESTP